MPRKTTRRDRRRSPRRRQASAPLKLWLAILFLVLFLIGSLALLGQVRRSFAPSPPAPAAPVVSRPKPPVPAAVPKETIQRELARLVAAAGGDPGTVRLSGAPADWVAQLPVPAPAGPVLEDFRARLAALGLTLAVAAPDEMTVRLAGRPAGRILFRPLPREVAEGRPQVAIIVDDLGRDLGVLRSLLAIDLPLGFAILPGEPHAADSARLVHGRGREVLIHIPMEPLGYPAVDPGGDALFVGQSPGEQVRRMASYRRQIPYAVGGNNHMGSRFTADPAGMAVVLGEMREAGLFFVDSRTTGASVAYELGRRAGLPVARRDVFLDNVAEEERVMAQLRTLVKTARRRGSAIGICHPHPATVAALGRAAALLEAAGVEAVPVSRLVEAAQPVP